MALFIGRIEACVTNDVQAEVMVQNQMAISSDVFNRCVAFCPSLSPKFEGGPFELIKKITRNLSGCVILRND